MSAANAASVLSRADGNTRELPPPPARVNAAVGPKITVSFNWALASGNTAPYVGVKDIVMMPSVVDVAGINRLSRVILAQAAGAICGMVSARLPEAELKPVIVASQFGNTTACVTHAREILEAAG